jgi:hypothetical protein
MDAEHHRLVRYVGTNIEVTVPNEITEIDSHCFAGCLSIGCVYFGSTSKLSSIDASAFDTCLNLFKIEIPSSVTHLGAGCFANCSSLQVVSFSTGSRLESIPAGAFRYCRRLESVNLLPSSVKTLENGCFEGCGRLVECPLVGDSGVVRIEESVFMNCESLRSMVLPPSVEFVGLSCFCGCNSLSRFTFVLPSRVRELLDLPPALVGFVDIPDSVEILSFGARLDNRHHRTLTFGVDSRLREVRSAVWSRSFSCIRFEFVPEAPGGFVSFLQVRTLSLKAFRSNPEFEIVN